MSRLDDFLANVAQAGLVLPHDLARARASLPNGSASDAARRLAKQLVRQGSLTSYQACKVLAGATRGFFLGGYRILRPLGEGGMGKVFLAAHETDGQRVAIKVLPPKRALEEGQALRRFRREMELSQWVQHPNLARTLGVGQEGDIHFMMMEYIPGESLYEAVKGERGGPLRVPDTARFFLKVLDGLEAAHNAGLVHRDIKPSNIMITPEGDARILDLGLARAMGEKSTLTRPNVVIGTLDYASPEQLGDAAKADRRSDLYSLGCTLYFTLSGRAPFEGGDVVNKIFKQRMDDPEPLERVARGVPAAFAAIVRKLMAKDPNDRYQTCAELRADLARWTDPEKVRSILGAEAEAARAFRPPPPELADDDLRLLDDDGTTTRGVALRDLGDAEPATAPMHKMPPKPVPALVLLPGAKRKPDTSLPPGATSATTSAGCSTSSPSPSSWASWRSWPSPCYNGNEGRGVARLARDLRLSFGLHTLGRSGYHFSERMALPMSGFQGSAMSQTALPSPDDVVEIGLLLPKNWANALIELSKRRQQSVGQILRHLIDRALTDDAIQDL